MFLRNAKPLGPTTIGKIGYPVSLEVNETLPPPNEMDKKASSQSIAGPVILGPVGQIRGERQSIS